MSTNVVTLTILRTRDAKRSEIELPLSSNLNSLKDAISSSSLGPIDRGDQRLFHLGRELKSGGRSLSALGLDRHDVRLIHVHCRRRAQQRAEKASSGDNEVDLADKKEEANEVNAESSNAGNKRRQSTVAAANVEGVIDLLESDDEDEVDVVEVGGTKRRRQR